MGFATLGRPKGWGFTTVGGWSDFHILRHSPEADVAFAPVLHIGATAGAPWWDMWDPRIVECTEQREQQSQAPTQHKAHPPGQPLGQDWLTTGL